MAARTIGELVVRIRGESAELDKTLTQTQTKFQTFSNNLNNIGNKMSLFVTAPLVALGAVIIKSSMNMEMLQTSFETMLGSADKAAKLMTDLKKMAAATPFTTPDLANASKMLLQYGVAVEDLIPNMQMLGDIASGDVNKFNSLALVFSQIKGLGRMTGQDLRQMINAGFNPLYVMANKLANGDLSKIPKLMADLNDKMSKGEISFEMVSQAMKDATSAGGQFYGGMERGSKTLQGLLSTLQDDAMELGRGMLAELMPVLKDLVKWLSGVIQEFGKMDEGTKKTILAILGIAIAAGPAIKAISGIMSAVKSFSSFVMANPVFLAIGVAIAALIAIGTQFAAVMNDALDPYKKFVDLQKQSVTQTDNLLTKYKELSSATEQTKESQDSLRLVTKDLIAKYPELAKMVDQETGILRLNEDQIRNIQLAEKQKLKDTLINRQKDLENLVASLGKSLSAYDAMPDWWKAMFGITLGGTAINIARGKLDEASKNIGSITDQLIELNKEIQNIQNPDRIETTRDKPVIESPVPEPEKVKEDINEYEAALREAQGSYNEIIREGKEEENRIREELRQQDLEAERQALEEKKAYYEKWAIFATGQLGNLFSSLGEALVTGQEGWVAFAKVAVGSIASIIEAIGQEFFARGAGAIALGLIPPPFGTGPAGLAAGAGLLAAGAGAMLIAGVVRGLASTIKMADGGMVYPSVGGTPVILGEAGVKEFAVPDKAGIWSTIADKISAKMGNTNNYNTVNNNLPGNLTLRIGDKEFGATLSDMSRNGKFLIDKNRGISRR